MKWAGRIVFAGFTILVVGLGWAIAQGPSASLNYRVIARLTLDGAVMSGSSVWALTATREPTDGGYHVVYKVRGEAIRLEGPGRNNVFLLRRAGDGFPTVSYGAFPAQCLGLGGQKLVDALRGFTGPCELKQWALPMIVAFGDLNDPRSSTQVTYDGLLGSPNCHKACLELSIVRTDDAVTVGLEHVLPWLMMGSMNSEIGTGVINKNDVLIAIAGKLYNLDFSTEAHWSVK